MIERTIVLPTSDNDGHSTRAAIARIQAEILDIAGGYSESTQTGVWRDEDTGKVYRDKSIRLVTTVTPEQDIRLAHRLPAWCAWLRQLCLYTHTTPVVASFVEPARETVQAAS